MKNVFKATIFFAPIVAMACVGIEPATADVKTYSQADTTCLALNMYHEARSESDIGQLAVGYVTMNRVESSRYPSSICGVVKQGKKDSKGNMIRHKCQFSWYCDGKSDKTHNESEWIKAVAMATKILNDPETDPTEGAIMYHADYVSPYWKSAYDKTVTIDTHIFYK